jgi:hypothetical protein
MVFLRFLCFLLFKSFFMSPFRISPVRPTADRFQEEVKHRLEEKKSPLSITKVKGFVLDRIGQSANRSALLSSAIAPWILVDLLSPFSLSDFEERERFQESSVFLSVGRVKKNQGSRRIPIGLKRKRHFPFSSEWFWVNPFNALMQFLMFLPGFADLFFFAPKSFQPFQDFIDQYKRDQQENRAVSSANTLSLACCAMKKLPSALFKGEFDFYQFFQHLVKALFPSLPILLASPLKSCFPDSLAFHPQWHVIWDANQKKTLEEWVQEKYRERPPELLVSIQGVGEMSCNLIQRQFFTSSEWFYYDLDAFIEMRPDNQLISSVAYLKVEGSWYQCDDDRISQLRSNCLNLPLCRSVLLHYRRVELGRSGWG